MCFCGINVSAQITNASDVLPFEGEELKIVFMELALIKYIFLSSLHVAW